MSIEGDEMSKITIEELKKLAEWMEYEFIDRLHVKNKHGHYVADGRPWLEKGGKDLAEVLSKLEGRWAQEDWAKFQNEIDKPQESFSILGRHIWFQNPDNAETILRAVAEVIE